MRAVGGDLHSAAPALVERSADDIGGTRGDAGGLADEGLNLANDDGEVLDLDFVAGVADGGILRLNDRARGFDGDLLGNTTGFEDDVDG